MKNKEINTLDVNQRKLLRLGVALILIIFLVVYFLVQGRMNKQQIDDTVMLQESKLQIFNDKFNLKQYPDRVFIHYPYFLVIQADKPRTTIYNLNTKAKVKEIKDVLLDYYDGNIVYNKQETYFNDKSLGVYCEGAFIKTKEVLCITRVSRDSVDNRLISINLKNGLEKSVYQSENVLTTVSVINNDLYVGEINIRTKQNYLSINKKLMPVSDIVSVIYPLNSQPYFASFQSALNNQKENYYIIKDDSADKVQNDKIIFYKD